MQLYRDASSSEYGMRRIVVRRLNTHLIVSSCTQQDYHRASCIEHRQVVSTAMEISENAENML